MLAMRHAGLLTIETANVEIDSDYVQGHAQMMTGPYVLLAMSDTGSGIDSETMVHIFEPFFTTKGSEGGTGLGLSTVYGIVKQSGGFIWVYSEPGHGTTFKIYLPQVEGSLETQEEDSLPSSLEGSETILLVEDDEMVRRLARYVLQTNGYTVLETADGARAVDICRQHIEPIHLLLTDVVLPQMNDQQLAEEVAAVRPAMKVLFMSGWTENAIHHRGVLLPGVHFIEKPFTAQTLPIACSRK